MIFKHRGLLKLAADTQAGDLVLGQGGQVDVLAEKNRAGVGPGFTSNDIHHGGFTGAIGTDYAAQFARIDGQRQIVERAKAVETNRNAVDIENHTVRKVDVFVHFERRLLDLLGAAANFCHCGHYLVSLRRQPKSPFGKNTVTTTNKPPRK